MNRTQKEILDSLSVKTRLIRVTYTRHVLAHLANNLNIVLEHALSQLTSREAVLLWGDPLNVATDLTIVLTRLNDSDTDIACLEFRGMNEITGEDNKFFNLPKDAKARFIKYNEHIRTVLQECAPDDKFLPEFINWFERHPSFSGMVHTNQINVPGLLQCRSVYKRTLSLPSVSNSTIELVEESVNRINRFS